MSTALITGASVGLGLEFAKLFAKDKYNLVLVARSGDKLEEIKAKLEEENGITAYVFACDLTEENSAERVYRFTRNLDIDIDVLVNNAGFGDFGEFAVRDYKKQREMVNLNIVALMNLTHLYLTGMLERKSGKILNLASVASFQPGPLMSVYYASKAFVLSFSEALYVELKKSGVSVTALCPGPVRTNFEKNAELSNSGLFKKLKVASPEKVAVYGYKKLMKGKPVAIQGGRNRFLVFSLRFAPRSLVRKIVYGIMKLR